MEILPAWMIEEIRKMKEQERLEEERPRVYVELPSPLSHPRIDIADIDDRDEESRVVIPLR